MTRLHTSDTDISAALRARSAARRASGRGRGRGGGGGGGEPSGPTGTVGLYNFSGSNIYWTAGGGAPLGNTAGCSFAVVARADANTVTQTLATHDGGATGWRIDRLSGTTGYRFIAASGTGVQTISPVGGGGAGLVGRTDRIVGVVDVTSSVLRLYVNGVQIGAGTACVGYTVGSGVARTTYGTGAGGGSPGNESTVVGLVAANATILTPAQVATWDAAVIAAGDIVPFPAGTTNMWRAGDNESVAATWADSVGAVDLLRVGAPLARTFTPVWA